jgi:tetratricopeptide (TPR) repeat protein
MAFYRLYLSDQVNASVAERLTRVALYQSDYETMLNAASIWVQAKPSDTQAHFFKSLAASYLNLHDLATLAMLENLRLAGLTDFTRLVQHLDQLNFNSEAEQVAVHLHYEQVLLQAFVEYPDSYDVPLALSLLSLLQGLPNRAIEMAKLARNRANNDVKVVKYALHIFETLEDSEQVIRCYEILLNISPDDEYLRHRFAIYLTDNFVLAAIEQLILLKQSYPDNASYLFHLALLYINSNQVSQARSVLYKLRQFVYYQDEANYYLGVIALDEGKSGQAEEYLLQIKSPRLLAKRYQALLDVYLLDSKFEQAVQQTHLLEPFLNDDSAATNYLSQSSLLSVLGDFDAALIALEKVEAINAGLSQIYFRRAMIFRQQGKLQQSEQVMEYFISLEPNNASSMHLLGRWLAEDTRQYTQALAWFKKASQVDSESAAILDDLGWILFQLNRLPEAKSYLAKAQRLV